VPTGQQHRNTRLDSNISNAQGTVPANAETTAELARHPELHARHAAQRKNEVVARLGDDIARVTAKRRRSAATQEVAPGKFVHPGACFIPPTQHLCGGVGRDRKDFKLRKVS
jgi:hypothetical protein